MNAIKSLLIGCVFAAAAAYGPPARSAPEDGWWWNPAESGRGFFVESDGEITFIGAYFYDNDGHATWLVAGGPNKDPYNFTGQLFSLRDGQTLYGAYATPSAPNYAGTLSVHFSDDTHGTLTWPGGTVAIERQIFGGATGPGFRPIPGWWWNPDESGSGYSIEVQGNNLFLVGFMYDDAGRPVWYFSAGPMTSPTTYHGSILQFADGQTIGGPYRPPGTPATIGTLDIAFTSNDAATLTFTELPAAAANAGLPAARLQPAAGRTRRVPAQVEFAKPYPAFFSSSFTLTDVAKVELTTLTTTITGSAKWYPAETNILGRNYKVTSGQVLVRVVTEFDAPGIVTCRGSGQRLFDDATSVLDESNLVIFEVPTTRFDLVLEIQNAFLEITTTCTTAGGSTTASTYVDEAFRLDEFDKVQDSVRTGQSARGSFYKDVTRPGPFSNTSGKIDFFAYGLIPIGIP